MCLEVKRTVSVRNFHVVREKQKKYKRNTNEEKENERDRNITFQNEFIRKLKH